MSKFSNRKNFLQDKRESVLLCPRAFLQKIAFVLNINPFADRTPSLWLLFHPRPLGRIHSEDGSVGSSQLLSALLAP